MNEKPTLVVTPESTVLPFIGPKPSSKRLMLNSVKNQKDTYRVL